MRLIAFSLVTVATLAGVVAVTAPASNQEGAPIFVTNIPPGYRDWRLISVAHEEGNFHSFSAVLGNDLAIQAYREGKVPFPDGAIIAALHYRHVPSEENNKVFGQAQSFVPGTPTNIQFMVKDTKKIRCYWRLGFRSFPGRQTCRRGVHEALLPLPQSNQSARPYLHPLRTIRTAVTRCWPSPTR